MILHSTTRRNAIIAMVLIWVLVCGGLGWSTWSAVKLEDLQARSLRDRAQQSEDQARREANAQVRLMLGRLVDSLFGAELTHPVEHYRAFYRPAKAYHSGHRTEVTAPIELESPLRTLKADSVVLLHFQVSVTQGWSSPQVERPDEYALPASAFPAADRAKAASAENWLAALRERYDPFSLLHLFEEALDANATRPLPAERERTAVEFAQRVESLIEVQQALSLEPQCEPQPVVIENLQPGDQPLPIGDGPECRLVTPTRMLPAWLDLTLDGHDQLAFIRTVSVEGFEYCTLQGVLLDWDRLHEKLEAEVQRNYPDAKIVPVKIGAPAASDALRGIPARLVSSAPEIGEPIQLGTGLTLGLIVTWGVTILALVAVSYLTMKYVTMTERRMRFVAAVTHELRTPLTSFQLYTDLLSDMGDDDAPEQRKQYVATLRKESRRLSRLVENVLVYSKIGDARPLLHASRVSPGDVLERIRDQTTEQCRSAGKELVVVNHCDEKLLIETDTEFVLQILQNLVENACKYSGVGDDPRIWLSVGPSGTDGLTFAVEDPGDGVAPRDRKAVFEPFRRSNSGRNDGTSGMGLGLALSRYWASCLGGRLVLRRGEKNGSNFSRFALILPRQL